jgi:hypothetical protein
LFKPVDHSDGRELLKICLQSGDLPWFQIVAMTPHQTEQTPALASVWIDFPPARQEVMHDQPNYMEAVGHDAGIGKLLLHQRAIRAGQVHAHHLHPIPSRQFGQVRLQRRFATAEHHIKYRVPLQIAQVVA